MAGDLSRLAVVATVRMVSLATVLSALACSSSALPVPAALQHPVPVLVAYCVELLFRLLSACPYRTVNTVASLGEEFLGAFADIEQCMKLALGRRGSSRFMDVARDYVEAHKLPIAYLGALQVFANLRNAIDHNSHRGAYPIAQPIQDVVDEIKRLRIIIRTPPTAMAVLPEMEVCSVDLSHPLSAALEHIRRFDFSQLPVYDENRHFGMLTSNTIARWLATEIGDPTKKYRDASVREVLDCSEPSDRALLVSPDLTAADALYQLAHGGPDGGPVNALIVTENGRDTDRPMRVIVVYDVPALSAALRFD